MIHPVTIDRRQATHLIRLAHTSRTLPAQNGIVGTYYEVVGDKVCRCAIGALFDEASAQELEASSSYWLAPGLTRNNLLIVPPADRDWFIDVQRAHDSWATLSSHGEDTTELEQNFLALLQ